MPIPGLSDVKGVLFGVASSTGEPFLAIWDPEGANGRL